MTYLNVGVKGLNSKLHTVLHGIVKTQCVKKSQSHIKMLNTRSLHIYMNKTQDIKIVDYVLTVMGARLSEIFVDVYLERV